MVVEKVEKVLTLIKTVSDLEKEVDRLNNVVADLRDKLVRMEVRIETNIEVAREGAKTVAAEQVAGMMGEFGSRVEAIKNQLNAPRERD